MTITYCLSTLIFSSLFCIVELSDFKPCSTEQILQFTNRCGPIEQQLTDLRTKANVHVPKQEELVNMTDLCRKISNCYGSIKCQESIDKKAKIDEKCEEDQYRFGEVPTCIKCFFKEVFDGNYYPCLKEHDFLSYNLTAKRDAFLSGQSCVEKVLNESQFFECEPESAQFIILNYEKVVDYLTMNQTRDSCDRVHYVYQKLQCEVIQDIWDWEKLELRKQEFKDENEIEQFTDVAKNLTNCVINSCAYSDEEINEIMNESDGILMEKNNREVINNCTMNKESCPYKSKNE